MAEKKKDDRSRNWCFLVYPESAKEGWKEYIDSLTVPWCCILHDKDFDENGEAKKAHYHVVIAFSQKKSFDQIQDISDMCSGVKPEKVANMKGKIRYLPHMDNPEKAQYSISDIECHCGFDIDIYLKANGRDRRQIIKEMMDFIIENDIKSFAEFADYCYTERFDDWSDIVTDRNTLFLKEYIKSHSLFPSAHRWGKHSESDDEG